MTVNVKIKSIALGGGEFRFPTEKVFLVGNDPKFPPLIPGEVIGLPDSVADELLGGPMNGVLEITHQAATRASPPGMGNGAAKPAAAEPAAEAPKVDSDVVLDAFLAVDVSVKGNATAHGFPNKRAIETTLGHPISVSDYTTALHQFRE